jgi:hypothetical protein
MSTEHVLRDTADALVHIEADSGVSGPYRDLCSNCNHAETCCNRRGSNRPVFFCEEFDVFVPVQASAVSESMSTQQPKRQNVSRGIGLCVNCDNAKTCTLPKPEGGVWHCEEYC